MIQRLCFIPVAALLALVLGTGLPAAGAVDPNVVQVAADAGDAERKPDDGGAAKRHLNVAVLDFTASTPDGAELGSHIAEIVAASLGDVEGFKVVDRTSLAQVLKEHELNLSGLVNSEQAAKVGQLAGARLLVTGKLFAIDNRLFIQGKIIGTETTLVEGVVVRGQKDDGADKLIEQLCEALSAKLREKGAELVAPADAGAAADPVPALAKTLAKVRKPVIAVHVSERRLPGPAGGAAAAGGGSAVETEIKKALRDAGFKVIEGGEREQAEGGVEVVVGGEAFSELAARIGNLVSCSARAELKLTDRKTGALLYVDRETARAAALSEGVAGKDALQHAGHTLAVRLLQHFANTLKSVERKGGAGQEKK